MPRELTQGEITTRELDRLISEIKDEKLKSQIRETISRLELHKSYGLRFERHLPEVITHEGKTIDLGEQYFPWLRKVEQVKGKNPKGPEHLLLECDNYIALKYLQYTHQGKVDVIYIDPPYNTRARDWKYNNDYVDTEDVFKHSKWLSFMEKRLKLAKNLLSKEGVLVCSIDDYEACPLGLLLDEIFVGRQRQTVIVNYNRAGTAKGGFYRQHEYYYFMLPLGFNINKQNKEVTFQDRNLRRAGNNCLRKDRPTLFYPITINPKTLEIIQAGTNPPSTFHPKAEILNSDGTITLWPVTESGEERSWSYGTARVNDEKKTLEVRKVKGQHTIRFKTTNGGFENYKTIWSDKIYDATVYGSNVLKTLSIQFPYPKSIYAVQDAIKSVERGKSSLILDFFAGSGTTYQAVAELNEEDGGSRQCILVTNNESNICREVTWERVKRVTTGTHDYPECTKKYDGNPSAHATFYTMEIYTDDEIDQQTRGWKKNMEGYLPLVSSKFNIAHNWKKIPDTRGYYCEGTAILSTDELDYEAQSFLKKESIDRLIIISEDKEEFELARKRCKKTTKVSEFHFLPRNYREYFANFHTKA